MVKDVKDLVWHGFRIQLQVKILTSPHQNENNLRKSAYSGRKMKLMKAFVEKRGNLNHLFAELYPSFIIPAILRSPVRVKSP